MGGKNTAFKRLKTAVFGALLVAATGVSPAMASDFTAAKVLNDMSTEERSAYVAGVVEGLAYARYASDGKKPDGMKCIYDWLYYEEATPKAILAAFKRFPDYTPGAIIAAMLVKECGT